MKRLITPISLLLFLAARVEAATVVQYAGPSFGGSTTASVAFGSNVTGGNSIVCVLTFVESVATTVTSVAGSVNGTFTAQTGPTKTGAITTATYVKHGITGGAETMTATVTQAVFGRLGCTEVSGATVTQTGAINAQTAPGTGTNAVTSGSATTTQANAYCAGITQDGDGGSAISGGTGWGSGSGNDGGFYFNWEDQIKATAGTLAATYTASAGSDHYQSGIICVEASGGGGGFVLRSQGLLKGVGR